MEKINNEWESIKFEMKKYKESETHILTGSSLE